uniref:Uncharacterized protein n=1 Tax=Hyaloperonospora arabidopsidis (strain Emoy2) TaxID=559515 RepID=M4BTH5_HYAAE
MVLPRNGRNGTIPEDVLKGSRDGGITLRIRTRPIAAVNVSEIELVSFDPEQCPHHRIRGPRDLSDVLPVEQRHRVVNGSRGYLESRNSRISIHNTLRKACTPYKCAIPTTTVHPSAPVPIKLNESSQSRMRTKKNLRLRSVKCRSPVTIRHRLDRESVPGRSTLTWTMKLPCSRRQVVPMNGWTDRP